MKYSIKQLLFKKVKGVYFNYGFLFLMPLAIIACLLFILRLTPIQLTDYILQFTNHILKLINYIFHKIV